MASTPPERPQQEASRAGEDGGGPRGNSRRGRALAVGCVALLAVALFPFLWKPWIHGNDGARNYAYCRSFWIDGDFDFSNEYAHYRRVGEMDAEAMVGRVDPSTGKPGNALGIGSAVLWSPFFLLAHLRAKVAADAIADGYGPPYVRAVCLGSTLYAVVGLVLLTSLLARRFGPVPALVAVLSVWLGSPLVFYMYLHPSMSHACSFFLCTLLIWEYERWRRQQRLWHFLAMGLTGGLAVVTRFSDGAFLLIPAAFWLRAVITSRPAARHAGGARANHPIAWLLFAALFLCAGVAAGVSPQLVAWRSFHGSWLAGPRDYGLSRNLSVFWKSPHLLEVLFSGWRGLFVWSPVLIFGTAGYIALLRRGRLLYYALAAAALIQLWVIGGWSVWWGGASFGQRFFINLVPVFAMGTACLFEILTMRVARWALALLLGVSVLWSAGLAVQYVSGMISREDRVTLAQLARNQTRRVPAWVREHVYLLLPERRANAPARPRDGSERTKP